MSEATGERLAVSVRVAAAVVAASALVGTSSTWTTVVTVDGGLRDRSAWTAGAWPAAGAVLTVAGAVVSVLSTCVSRGRRATLGVVGGAAVTAAGVASLLVERYRPPLTVTQATYAYRASERPNPVVEALPGATAWVTAAGLGALVVAAVVFPSRSRSRRAGAALGALGAVLLVVGASGFPWTFGFPTSAAVPLWRAGADGVTGAVLLLLAALLLAVAVLRPRRAVAVTAALLAAGGLGVLLPQRLPNPWGGGATGWYAYQPLESVTLPPAWRFHAATTLVLLGAVLVLAAATRAGQPRTPRCN